jgi:hypothetical protein
MKKGKKYQRDEMLDECIMAKKKKKIIMSCLDSLKNLNIITYIIYSKDHARK